MSHPPILAFLGDSDAMLVQMLLPAGLVLITIALFARLRKRHRRRAAGDTGSRDDGLTARERVERYRQEKGVRGDLQTLMVEIEQLARHMGAQLDAKTVQLERLIQQADDRLDRLRRATDDNAAAPAPPTPIRQAHEPPVDRVEVGDPLSRSVCELADQGLAPIDIARHLDEHVGKVELILALRKAGG